MPSEKHIIVKGKKYKKSPLKDSPRKRKLVKGLMKARRDVKTALDKKNAKSERNARNRVQKFKVLLGERSGKKTEIRCRLEIKRTFGLPKRAQV